MSDSPLIFAAILDGPIDPATETRLLASIAPALGALNLSGRVGARLRFEGIVRRDEPAPRADMHNQARSTIDAAPTTVPLRALAALDYQSYDPMAERQLDSLARDVAREYGLLALLALHSRGRVGVGEISFVLTILSAHRAEALAAMAAFIDRLKRDVPIWKSPVWAK